MKIVNLLTQNFVSDSTVAGIGTFDGVHIGHQILINNLIDYAQRNCLRSVIFTFDHPPKGILEPDKFPGEITLFEEKLKIIEGMGVDYVVYRPFDSQLAALCPEGFLRNVIFEQLKAKAVFTGFNFVFGLNRSGNAKFLEEECLVNNVYSQILPRVSKDGITVSSSFIREKILTGEVDVAGKYLGRDPFICGRVIQGDRRGRQLGFPTANIELEGSKKVVPMKGVYEGTVETVSGIYPAMINIGIRPTFHKIVLLLEAHLLNFREDIYQTEIKVNFKKRLRNEIKFPDKESLIQQINRDLSQIQNPH
ncbi:MAG: bifunctional riboflavin kinase/FAD synthetase [Candidatus Riflebacteria bacterium]|nr:bifunctional riboflavin kinase/FAD synthetase [Candidatus Riflebacteria bacterium]